MDPKEREDKFLPFLIKGYSPGKGVTVTPLYGGTPLGGNPSNLFRGILIQRRRGTIFPLLLYSDVNNWERGDSPAAVWRDAKRGKLRSPLWKNQ